MSGQSSVRKMSCQVDVMSGKRVQKFEPEPWCGYAKIIEG